MKKLLPLFLFLCSCSRTAKINVSMNAPSWMQDQLSVSVQQPDKIPAVFADGYILMNQRDDPGSMLITDAAGHIVWYHQVKGTGCKSAHFTHRKTILCILGDKTYPTSYGNEILEISLTGDTLLHLKKGTGDFTSNVHHEVLLTADDHVVMLTSTEKIADLRAQGGGERDTVKSDGILVTDRHGKKIWQWSVFDVLDPAADKDILHTRSDWMHANSLSFDKDSNYLISFYNNGQIWKLDAKTGKVHWKFGRGGDFSYPDSAGFDMGHAVHLNADGDLMLFDNGVSRQQSQTLAFHLDLRHRRATVKIKAVLPAYLFNERMGSAYLTDNNSILQCSSKRNTLVLGNREGTPLWTMRCTFIPYRAEFISREQLLPYIFN
ncbi:aryl-sulfate sulfotransferase [Chitinophaga solisilvae]|uniref:aryl-sulfate sulfotransferase n=1 Tax=Chitinophaga solisilvae TaxID=1233460 RepID=UPI001370B68C|nr:aryl-sulfate sulfotransferase [Chitinophaga solisilvae]